MNNYFEFHKRIVKENKSCYFIRLRYFFQLDKKKRKTKLPFSQCDPGGTQTRDTQNRNLMLYSTELRGLHFSGAKIDIKGQQAKFGKDKAEKTF